MCNLKPVSFMRITREALPQTSEPDRNRESVRSYRDHSNELLGAMRDHTSRLVAFCQLTELLSGASRVPDDDRADSLRFAA